MHGLLAIGNVRRDLSLEQRRVVLRIVIWLPPEQPYNGAVWGCVYVDSVLNKDGNKLGVDYCFCFFIIIIIIETFNGNVKMCGEIFVSGIMSMKIYNRQQYSGSR